MSKSIYHKRIASRKVFFNFPIPSANKVGIILNNAKMVELSMETRYKNITVPFFDKTDHTCCKYKSNLLKQM